MRAALPMQRDKGLLNIGVDPCRHALLGFGSTHIDNVGKGSIGCYLKPVLPDNLGKRTGYNEAVQWQNRTRFGLDPECLRIIPRIGHREHPVLIRTDQQVNIKRHD
jgi:hypothetical protein